MSIMFHASTRLRTIPLNDSMTESNIPRAVVEIRSGKPVKNARISSTRSPTQSLAVVAAVSTDSNTPIAAVLMSDGSEVKNSMILETASPISFATFQAAV